MLVRTYYDMVTGQLQRTALDKLGISARLRSGRCVPAWLWGDKLRQRDCHHRVALVGQNALMNWVISNLRAIWRLTRVALHLAAGSATVFCVYPMLAQRWRLAIKQRWSRQLLEMFGVELKVSGTHTAVMQVANHVSWLDILAINAVSPAAFVAKADVRDWPLIGWMSARTDTIYIRRGSLRAAHETTRQLAACLAEGLGVVVFPEGTTSDGFQVLPFHGALLQGAIMSGVPVQPVALRYQTGDERPAQAPVYCGETSLLQSMWRVATASGLAVRLEFLAAHTTVGVDRRQLAARLRGDIAAALCLSLDGASIQPRQVQSANQFQLVGDVA